MWGAPDSIQFKKTDPHSEGVPVGDISDDCSCDTCGAGPKRDKMGEAEFIRKLQDEVGGYWLGVSPKIDKKYSKIIGHTEATCMYKKCVCCYH